MRKTALLVLLAVFAFTLTAYAHPPSDIKITYDPGSKTLTAVIFHNVSNPSSHYIKKVNVALNGKEIAVLEFTHQDNNETQTVKYAVPAAQEGDALSVEAFCSISGKLAKEIKIKTGK